jgi:glycosyltransferase involved in cell wall biosynthesis
MKIVFLTRKFWPEIGGVEKHCLEVGKRLVKENHQLIVITEKIKKEASSNTKQSGTESAKATGGKDGIKILRIDPGRDNWFKKFRVWKELWSIKSVLRDADIIHCHDVFYWYLPFRLMYPTKKVFITFHGYEGNNTPGIKAKNSHKIAEKLTKGNICIGEFLKKWYGTKPTIISYGATDSTRISKEKSDSRNILFLGRLEEETGIMEYLKAIKILGKDFKYDLRILGDGSLKKKAEVFCKVNELNVKFYGFVDDIVRHLDKSNIVFVSRYLGILEALASKNLIFSVYNNEIKKDYLKMTPFKNFIYINKDAEGIANNLLEKIDQKKIDSGYEWAKKQTWEELTKKYLKLWS